MMKESLRQQVKASAAEYESFNRGEWIFGWPSQIVLTLDQVFWTQSIEQEGISKMKSDPFSLKRVF